MGRCAIDLSGLTEKFPERLHLRIYHKVPSLNALFDLNPWQRNRLARETLVAVESMSLVTAEGSLIPITSALSNLSMPCDTLKSCAETPPRTS